MDSRGFSVISGNHPNNDYLHTHNEYEIYMFLEGDSRYVVNDREYTLSPNDIIVIRKNELHRVYHNSEANYTRSVIMVSPSFFQKHGCIEYENAFLGSHLNEGNKISAKTVMSSGIYDTIYRLKKYSDDFKDLDRPVIAGIMVELLYLINEISTFEKPDTIYYPIKNIINFIDNHFTEKITLDLLCDKFFISKSYLCRIFKQTTGLTIQKYIEQKRLELAVALIKEGKSKSKVAMLSGFKDYRSLHRAYMGTKAKDASSNEQLF